MKKYIWVKDGDYEWLTTFSDYDNARNRATELGLTYSLKIVKQADTIEELCDEFVVEEYSKESDVLYSRVIEISLEEALNSRNSTSKCYYKIYGAIWTKNGLIYVAKMKMDEERKFELL